MMAMTWARFAVAIMPDLVRVGRILYEAFDGDAAEARALLRRIRAHGDRLDLVRREIDDALLTLRARRAIDAAARDKEGT